LNLNKSMIVSATGQAMFGIGGPKTHKTAEFKGYCVSLEWDMADGEPVMLIWSPLGGLGAGVFGICLSSAGKYANPDGRPTEECFMEAAAALPTLGRALIRLEVSTLVDVIIQFLPDLLTMPPASRASRLEAKGKGILEVTQTDVNGKVISESLL